jgi:predicted DNA-binding transcriptional regulator YafY
VLGGARTDLTGLTVDEARALFLRVGPPAGTSPQATSALRKLVRALPATFRADAEAAAAVVDPAAWGDRGVDARTELVGVLQTAIVQRSTVRLTYIDRRRRGLPGGSKEM